MKRVVFGTNSLTLLVISVAILSGIIYGYNLEVIPGALLFMEQSIPMSVRQIGAVISVLLLSSLASAWTTVYLVDRIGRRAMMILACLIFILASLILSVTQSYEELLIARALLGSGLGILAIAVPHCLSGLIAPMRRRGMLIFAVAISLGMALAYGVDQVFTPMGSWQLMHIVLLIPSSLLLVISVFLPKRSDDLTIAGDVTKTRASLTLIFLICLLLIAIFTLRDLLLA